MNGPTTVMTAHEDDPYCPICGSPICEHPERNRTPNGDVPESLRSELMRCAMRTNVSWYYLCRIYRQGVKDGCVSVVTERSESSAPLPSAAQKSSPSNWRADAPAWQPQVELARGVERYITTFDLGRMIAHVEGVTGNEGAARARQMKADLIAALLRADPSAAVQTEALPNTEHERVLLLTNIRTSAAAGLVYGTGPTVHTPERVIERKNKALRDILTFLERDGIVGSVLRSITEDEIDRQREGVAMEPAPSPHRSEAPSSSSTSDAVIGAQQETKR